MIANSISSLIFTSNAIMLWLHDKHLYATLMCVLVITSVYNHYINTTFSAIIDKIAVYMVVLYGAHQYFAYSIKYTSIIFVLFIASGVIYYAVLPQIETPITYVYVHGLLHFVASIGHHLIALPHTQ